MQSLASRDGFRSSFELIALLGDIMVSLFSFQEDANKTLGRSNGRKMRWSLEFRSQVCSLEAKIGMGHLSYMRTMGTS